MTILETLASKAHNDLVYEMTLEELIAWYGSRTYSPIGQATLNNLCHLEQLQNAIEAGSVNHDLGTKSHETEISYKGIAYNMRSQWGIDSLRRAIERNGGSL
jgi:hypothetical protein